MNFIQIAFEFLGNNPPALIGAIAVGTIAAMAAIGNATEVRVTRTFCRAPIR